MNQSSRRNHSHQQDADSGGPRQTSPTPGKRTLTESLPVQRERSSTEDQTPSSESTNPGVPTALRERVASAFTFDFAGVPAHASGSAPVVQQRGSDEQAETAVHAAAAHGVATPSSPLPFADTIQHVFGRHDISSVQAHTGPAAEASARAMGAAAYATGNHVVLGGGADLHTVAHEAAHVVQQRGGVQLKGGVGEAGDHYEQHADAVADRVVAGQSAEELLEPFGGTAATSATGPVQRRPITPTWFRDPSALTKIIGSNTKSEDLKDDQLIKLIATMRNDVEAKDQAEEIYAFEMELTNRRNERKGLTMARMEYPRWDEVEPLLGGYGVTDSADQEKVRLAFEKTSKNPNILIRGIPDLLVYAKVATTRANPAKHVRDANTNAAPDAGQSETITLGRDDTRTPAQIIGTDGLFGWDAGVVTVEHARAIVEKVEKMSRAKQAEWARSWKAQTPAPAEANPWVATGTTGGQKSGNHYQCKVPLKFRGTDATVMQVGTDTGDIENANVIGVRLGGAKGEEVLMLTGIPLKYITHNGRALK